MLRSMLAAPLVLLLALAPSTVQGQAFAPAGKDAKAGKSGKGTTGEKEKPKAAPVEEDEEEDEDEDGEEATPDEEEDDLGTPDEGNALTTGGDATPSLKKPSVLSEIDEENEGDEGGDAADIFGEGAEDLVEEATVESKQEKKKEKWAEESTKFLDFSGYFRFRADLFHKFDMGFNPQDVYMPFPRPIEATNPFSSSGNLTGNDWNACADYTGKKPKWCKNHTLAGANIRLRFSPVIHLSENVRVLMQFDILDNLQLGSTPEGGGAELTPSGFSFLSGRNPWVPLEAFASSQDPPTWRNTLQNAIVVRAAWGEVLLPKIGMLKFGRMPSHFGMGLLANEGAGIDSDYGDLADRIMFATKLFGVILAVGWDFPASGPSSMKWSQQSGKAYDVSQLDDVNQWLLVVAYKQEKEEEERLLAEGKPAISTGLYTLFRTQVLSTENDNVPGASTDNIRLVERNAWAVIGDLWFRLLFNDFRIEMEGVIIGGVIDNIEQDMWVDDRYDVLQWGAALEIEQTFLDDALFVMLKTGFASGDSNVEGLTPSNGIAIQNEGKGDHRISAFRFDPDYNIDLILFEEILGQVAGAFYVRPSIGYWFLKDQLMAQLDIVYSVAAEPVSTNGNSPHLGVEFDLSIRYQTKDHFIGMLQYGYLVPLSGFEDLAIPGRHRDLSQPQTLQAFLGIVF